METLKAEKPSRWRYGTSLALSAVLIAGCTSPAKQGSETPAAPAGGANSPATGHIPGEPGMRTVKQRSLQEFAGAPVPKDWVEAVRDSTVKLIGRGSQCSGFIINQLVITAGHCLTGEGDGPIKIYRSNDQEVGELASWKYYNTLNKTVNDGQYDVGIARPRADIPGAYLVRDEIPHNKLQPGETFTTTGYPGGIKAPLTGTVVYMGPASASQNYFVLNTGQSRDMQNNFCEGGMSGSPVVGPRSGDIGVLDWRAQDPQGLIEDLSQQQNVDLSAAGVDRVCGVTMLTTAMFNELTAG